MSDTQIKFVDFQTVLNVWQTSLWPGRLNIEPASAMVYAPYSTDLEYDMENMDKPREFIALYLNDKIIGVNSGHLCGDGSYRSRGLWVDPNHRGKSLGVKLLASTIACAISHGSTFIWSYPRLTSRKTYEAAGFTISSDWRKSETSDSNAYCIRRL